MALEIRQVQRLAQQLVMTPQLRQAIKILQVSRTELESLVDEELAENPVLEDVLEEKALGRRVVEDRRRAAPSPLEMRRGHDRARRSLPAGVDSEGLDSKAVFSSFIDALEQDLHRAEATLRLTSTSPRSARSAWTT